MNMESPTLARVGDALGVSIQWLKTGEGAGPGATVAPSPEDSGTRRVSAPWRAFEDALEAAFDKGRGHRIADVDAIRDAFGRGDVPATASQEELERAALRMLDAARDARVQDVPVTLSEILMRVAGAA